MSSGFSALSICRAISLFWLKTFCNNFQPVYFGELALWLRQAMNF